MAKQRSENVFLIFLDLSVHHPLGGRLADADCNLNKYQTERVFLINKRNRNRCEMFCEIRVFGYLPSELLEQLAIERDVFPVVLIANHSNIPKTIKSGGDFLCVPLTAEILAAAVERICAREECNVMAPRWAFDYMSPRELEALKKVLAGMASWNITRHHGTSTETVKAHRARIKGKVRAREVWELIRKLKLWPVIHGDMTKEVTLSV